MSRFRKRTNSYLSIIALFLFLMAFTCCTEKSDSYEIKYSECADLPQIPYAPDSIIHGMHLKLEDSLWSNYWIPEHNSIMSDLEGYKKGTKKLFPYSDFDSTVFIHYETDGDHSIDLKKRAIASVKVMCPAKANLLLNIVNNPLNYSIGECGTSIPFSQVVFYLRKKKVGELTFSCGYSSLFAKPENNMIIGILNRQGDSLLTTLEPWK